MPTIDQYLDQSRLRFEEELCQFLRIPSVSADSNCQADMDRAADWLVAELQRLGLKTKLIPRAGHPPLVYAESPDVPGAPTVLVYGHYDVQPVEPLEAWLSPPFEPTRRDGNLYARGATDDKGQVFTHIKSAEAWMAVHGRLPVKLKYLIEGEEEIGSAFVEDFLRQGAAELACDVVVISDCAQFGPGQPAITNGLRGIAFFELHVKGPSQDLHSGTFGGSVMNPANALTKILAAMIDDQGRVQLPGFYDDVAPISDLERRQMAALPFDEAEYKEQIGVSALAGEVGYTTLERRGARPTFDINGIGSGCHGPMAKTIIPAIASAKFSFRLVPNQRPEKIAASLRTLLERLRPPGVELELLERNGAPGVVIPIDSPYIEAAARAIEHAFGCRPLYTREGGSIPIVTTFHEELGADSLLLGWGLDDDNAHSPNEKFSLVDFHRGIRASAKLWEELSKLPKTT